MASPSARVGGEGREEGSLSTQAKNQGQDSYFECNICLDGVREPVVTRCGHLFCWPCLYRWLNTNQTECPVCKAGVTAKNVVPLYGRGAGNVDPRTLSTGRDGVPNRPEAQRPQAERPRRVNLFAGNFGVTGAAGGAVGAGEGMGFGALAGGQMHFQAGLGFFPSLFGLQFQSFTSPARSADAGAGNDEAVGTADEHTGENVAAANERAGREALTAEEAQQSFLSRLLLILGSFVVLCLVVF